MQSGRGNALSSRECTRLPRLLCTHAYVSPHLTSALSLGPSFPPSPPPQGGIVYHVFFPYQNLVITIGLVYAVLAPIILPLVLIYSMVGYLVWKHQVGGSQHGRLGCLPRWHPTCYHPTN